MVGFSYFSLLISLVVLEACGSGTAKKNKNDVISCDGVLQSFTPQANDEILQVNRLTPGLYDYAGSEIYFEGEIQSSFVKIKSQEFARRNANSKQMELSHQYSCREGYTRSAEQTMTINDQLPRLLMVGANGSQLDVVERSFGLQVVDGYPWYSFSENEKSQLQTTTVDFKRRLDLNWNQHYFMHSDYKRYTFVGKKKVPNGWLHVRVSYVKIKGDILADGDLFMPLPDVQF